MSDQAQGLRALADQTRRDQSGYSLDTRPTPAASEAGVGNHPADTAVMPANKPLPGMQTGVALADARLHAPAQKRARLIAVTSGKGGVGKTNFSSNLALTLARSGQRVVVIDADLGLANLHVILGITPSYHLGHVMQGQKSLREILYPGPGGIQIICGGSGITELANLSEATRQAFVNGLRELDTLADVIIIDTGAGLSRNVMAFLCAVQEIIVVTTPEPTAITDAYATIKVVSQENPSAHLMLVVNMAQSDLEGEAVANKLTLIARQFLRVELDSLGCIHQDPSVARAVRAQQPFTLCQPQSAAARGVVQIAAQLGYRPAPATPASGIGGFLDQIQCFFGLRDPERSRARR
jgi:flagellar biosynthesis protein FlhG